MHTCVSFCSFECTGPNSPAICLVYPTPRAPWTSKRGLQVEWQISGGEFSSFRWGDHITKGCCNPGEGNVKVTIGALTLNSLNLGHSRVYSPTAPYFTVFLQWAKRKERNLVKDGKPFRPVHWTFFFFWKITFQGWKVTNVSLNMLHTLRKTTTLWIRCRRGKYFYQFDTNVYYVFIS